MTDYNLLFFYTLCIIKVWNKKIHNFIWHLLVVILYEKIIASISIYNFLLDESEITFRVIACFLYKIDDC